MSAEILEFKLKKKNEVWEPIESGLIKHIPSGIFYVRKFQNGKRLTVTTGTDKIGKARTIRDQKLAEWISGKVPDRKAKVAQICDELETVLTKDFENGDRRIRTLEHDKTYFPIIKKYFGHMNVTAIDEDFWDDWVRMTGRGLGRTLNDIAKYLSKTLTFAYKKKYLNRKPVIYNPDKKKKSGMLYENGDIENFIQHAEPDLKDLIIIGAECGLRPHENLGLKWEWITFEGGTAVISIPDEFEKRGQGRTLEASPNASECLSLRLIQRTGPYVFPSPKSALKSISASHLRKLWVRMKKRAGLPLTTPMRFQWLRHSFFTKALLDSKFELQEVSEYGGNSPEILMKRYLQSDKNRTRRVASAVNLNLIGEKLANMPGKKV